MLINNNYDTPTHIVTMHANTEEISEDIPWAMIFADDLVLCDELRERMEERLGKWMENAELKISREKAEHEPLVESDEKIDLKIYTQNDTTELPTTSSFKYLGTTLEREGVKWKWEIE